MKVGEVGRWTRVTFCPERPGKRVHFNCKMKRKGRKDNPSLSRGHLRVPTPVFPTPVNLPVNISICILLDTW